MMQTPTAPVLFRGAQFITLDPAQPVAAAMLVAGQRIRAVFAKEPEIPSTWLVLDLGGGTVVPGLHDAHLHLGWMGETANLVDLRGVTSLEAAVKRVEQRLTHPVHGWVVGMGWDQNLWVRTSNPGSPSTPPPMPTKEALDAVAPSVPVALERVDGHAVWVNSEALRLVKEKGVKALERGGRDPRGGRILRDEHGDPTGILVDTAADLIRGQVPRPTPQDVMERVAAGARRAADAGLTSVHAMSVGAHELAALQRLDGQGVLPIRVFAYLVWEDHVLTRLPHKPTRTTGLMEIRGVKLFADGSLGSRGAALLQPYQDESDHCGLWATEPTVLKQRAQTVSRRGFQLAIHAIGDHANRVVLDMLASPEMDARRLRHRVEHAQVVHPDDVPRFGELGLVASMQPAHCTSDMGWVERRLGKERLSGTFAWRSLAAQGAVLAFGSDAPVENVCPLWGMYAARTRRSRGGIPEGGWQPQELLEAEAALRAYSAGPAYAVGRQDELGVLKAGALADFTWLDRDPLAIAPADLLDVKVLGTAVGGQLRRLQGA